MPVGAKSERAYSVILLVFFFSTFPLCGFRPARVLRVSEGTSSVVFARCPPSSVNRPYFKPRRVNELARSLVNKRMRARVSER